MEKDSYKSEYNAPPRHDIITIRGLLSDLMSEYPDCIIHEHFAANTSYVVSDKYSILLKTQDGRYIVSKLISVGRPDVYHISSIDLEDMCHIVNMNVEEYKYVIYSEEDARLNLKRRGKFFVPKLESTPLDTTGTFILYELLTDEHTELGTREELRFAQLLDIAASNLESTHRV